MTKGDDDLAKFSYSPEQYAESIKEGSLSIYIVPDGEQVKCNGVHPGCKDVMNGNRSELLKWEWRAGWIDGYNITKPTYVLPDCLFADSLPMETAVMMAFRGDLKFTGGKIKPARAEQIIELVKAGSSFDQLKVNPVKAVHKDPKFNQDQDIQIVKRFTETRKHEESKFRNFHSKKIVAARKEAAVKEAAEKGVQLQPKVNEKRLSKDVNSSIEFIAGMPKSLQNLTFKKGKTVGDDSGINPLDVRNPVVFTAPAARKIIVQIFATADKERLKEREVEERWIQAVEARGGDTKSLGAVFDQACDELITSGDVVVVQNGARDYYELSGEARAAIDDIDSAQGREKKRKHSQ